jgi:hypothetical protein
VVQVYAARAVSWRVIIFSTNAWPIIRTQPQTVQRAVAYASPGTFTFATFHRLRRSRRPPTPTC